MPTTRQQAYAAEVADLMGSYTEGMAVASDKVVLLLKDLNRQLTMRIMAMTEDDWLRMNLSKSREELTALLASFNKEYSAEMLAALKKSAETGRNTVIVPMKNNLDISLFAFEPKVFKPVFLDPYIRQIWNVSSSLITNASREVSERIMSEIIIGTASGASRESVINSIVGELGGERLGFKTLNDRAWAIFRTENSRMHNLASELQMQGAWEVFPGAKKQWMHGILSGLGQEPREGHVALDGEEVPVEESFQNPVTGAWLRYPHDPLAPPSETVNCGCAHTLVMPEDSFLDERTLVSVE